LNDARRLSPSPCQPVNSQVALPRPTSSIHHRRGRAAFAAEVGACAGGGDAAGAAAGRGFGGELAGSSDFLAEHAPVSASANTIGRFVMPRALSNRRAALNRAIRDDAQRVVVSNRGDTTASSE
jgi:hypothetical protein